MTKVISVKRTGRAFSIASHEYEITLSDGRIETVWSPPWNDFNSEQEDAGALAYAKGTYETEEDDAPTLDKIEEV